MRIVGWLLIVLGLAVLAFLWVPGVGIAFAGSADLVLLFKLVMSGFAALIAIGGLLAVGIGGIRAELSRD